MRKGLTQKELAALLGVDQSAVAQWETGKCGPFRGKLPGIAKVLECSIDELLAPDGEEVKAPNG